MVFGAVVEQVKRAICTHQQEYNAALKVFNHDRSDENRLTFCNKKRYYKLLVRKKRRNYKFMQAKELADLKHSKPREFWKKFATRKQPISTEIKLDDFHKYFKEMFCDIENLQMDESDQLNHTHESNDPSIDLGELDRKITPQEVKSAILSLKRNKSFAPCDSLLNEYFIEASDILLGHLTDIFNTVFEAGHFPKCWSEGFIVPIHKKGDRNDVSNYRGVTLTSNLGKIFTGILNTRIDQFCEENSKLLDTQFGFRKGRSTVDAIYILKCLIDSAINKNQRLYCAFIDLKRAFDSINRDAMWLKLYNSGIRGKTLRIIRSMYESVKACIKHRNSYSDFFNISIGLRQGEKLSPIMFSLFLEDVEQHLQNEQTDGVTLLNLCVTLLLFADDMAIIGSSPEDLQTNLDSLESYCDRWGLEVNTEKSKIVVFRRGGKIKQGEKWSYKNKTLEIVNAFNYLGVVFKYTGSFVENSKCAYGKALKAMNVLLANVRKYELNPRTCMQLFDAFVMPILSYSAAVWGFNNNIDLERIHLKFCKRILGVRDNTSTVGVYGELGRYPLFIHRQVQIIKYWWKLNHTESNVLKQVYLNSVHECENGANNWASKVKILLQNYGLGYAWNRPELLDKSFLPIFKQRAIDNFIQKWYGEVKSNQVLRVYQHLKQSFGYEQYLDEITVKGMRSKLTQIRLSSNNLRINSGRYERKKLERQERICNFCDQNDIEDEFHFIFKCSKYQELRHR